MSPPVYDLGKAVVEIIDDSDNDLSYEEELSKNDGSNESSDHDSVKVDAKSKSNASNNADIETKQKAAAASNPVHNSNNNNPNEPDNILSTKKSNSPKNQSQLQQRPKRRSIFDLSGFGIMKNNNQKNNNNLSSNNSPLSSPSSSPQKGNPHPYHRQNSKNNNDNNNNNNNNNLKAKYDLGATYYQDNSPNRLSHTSNNMDESYYVEDSFVESEMSESPSEEEAHIHLLQQQYTLRKHSNIDNSSNDADDDYDDEVLLSDGNNNDKNLNLNVNIARTFSRNNDNEPVDIEDVEFLMDQSIAVSEIRPLSDDGDHNERMKSSLLPTNDGDDDNNHDGDEEEGGGIVADVDVYSSGIECYPITTSDLNGESKFNNNDNKNWKKYTNRKQNRSRSRNDSNDNSISNTSGEGDKDQHRRHHFHRHYQNMTLPHYSSDEEHVRFLSESLNNDNKFTKHTYAHNNSHSNSRSSINNTLYTKSISPTRALNTDSASQQQQQKESQQELQQVRDNQVQSIFKTSENSKKIELHEDVFSIMFVSPIISWGFLYSALIYTLQLFILALTLTNILKSADHHGNTLNVPPHTDFEVILAQFLALNLSVFTAKEVIHALDVFQIDYNASEILPIFPNATYMKWIMSHLFRSFVGLLGVFVAFLFIVQSTNVLDLFLDFAVVQFVGELDALGFILAERGFFLTDLKALIRKIKSIQFEEKDTISICGTQRVIKSTVTQTIMFSIALLMLLGPWTYIQIQRGRGFYYEFACQRFEVRFDDYELDFFNDYCKVHQNDIGSSRCPESWVEQYSEPIRYSSFSDVYEAQLDNDGTVYLKNGRPVYHQRGKVGMDAFGADSPPGVFEYCQEEKAWVFTVMGVHKGEVDYEDKGCNWLMKSPETEALSLQDIGTDGWIVWTGILDVGQDFTITCIECEHDRNDAYHNVAECTYHGYCGLDEACVCKENWMGSQCETCSSCSEIDMYVISGVNNTVSTLYRRFDWVDEKFRKSPVDVYGRSVYYKSDENGVIDPALEVIMYDGSRYVIWDLTWNDSEVEMKDMKQFLETLHSTWDFVDGTKVKFASERTKKPTFKGLKWAESLTETDEDKFIPIEFKCRSEDEMNKCPFFYNDFI